MSLGTSISCITDLDQNFALVSGRTALGQAVARRLITPRGRLLNDPDYGFDLRQYLNDDLGPGDPARIASGIEQEALKDERVLTASAQVTLMAGVMTVAIALQDAAGPFTLVLAVSAVTVSILKQG